MRIAYCFYGQPRLVEEGYKHVKEFLDANPGVEVDFYAHVWGYTEPGGSMTHYDAAQWRAIPPSHLRIDPNVIGKIHELYKPIAIQVDPPLRVTISPELQSKLIYQTSYSAAQMNIPNTLSQGISRQRVRDLFQKTVESSNVKYDFVIVQRFDFLNTVKVSLHELDRTKMHVGHHNPMRPLYFCAFFICPVDIFLNLFNLINNIPAIFNDDFFKFIQKKYSIQLDVTLESIVFANHILQYGTLDNIADHPGIPNFRTEEQQQVENKKYVFERTGRII